LRRSLLVHIIINLAFLGVSLYFTIKKKYVVSIIVSCGFILISNYVIDLLING